jgi:hypothetical protein
MAQALWRLMLGRQETEGVLGKSRTAGLTGLGSAPKVTEQGICFRRWLALSRVYEEREKIALTNRSQCSKNELKS